MMQRALRVLSVLILLTACTSSPTAEGLARLGEAELFADQSTLPAGSNGSSVLTENDADTENIWTYFGFDGQAPEIESEDRVALFVGTGESGSCPIELEGVQVREDEVSFDVAENDGPCTADFRPRSFVFLFPAKNAPEVGDRVNLGPSEVQSAEAVLSERSPAPTEVSGPATSNHCTFGAAK